MDIAWLSTAFMMGLLGGTHCVGMCGGLSAAFTFALPTDQRQGWSLLRWQLLYNSGRLLTYAMLGLLAALLLSGIAGHDHGLSGLRIVAGALMILTGAYVAGWFQGLQYLERLGGPLWRLLSPLRQRLFPIKHAWQAVAAGMCWGLLPCGLVYSAMSLSATTGHYSQGSLTMLAFGLGTLPTLLITGTAAAQLKRLLQHPGTRQSAGVLMLLFGLWTIIGTQLPHHAEHHGDTMDHSDPHHDHIEHHH